MKELSIEEKARAYDEALERAREYWETDDDNTLDIKAKGTMEYLFPELAESNDEKTRKEILEFFQQFDNEELRGVNISDWIAWLEKQGESDETKAKMFLINKGYPIDTNGTFPTYEEMYNIIREGLEQQDEQKPVDKDKPKFKVGDWVINDEDGDIQQIIEIQRINEHIFYIGDNTFFNKPAEKYWRLWTIDDAKDGDVIVNGSNIFIFHFINDTRLMGYCHVNTDDGRFYDDIGKNECFCLIDAVVNPATKEQRDTLFAKMKEAGYEWDAKNKELNKIHIIDEGKAEMDHCFTKMMNGEKVSSTWSEEDELQLQAAIEICENSGHTITSNWLKSLKNRVYPKQEWTKEDKERYISCLQRLGTGNPDQPETINSKWFKEHITFLPKRKPSDEQMHYLANVKLGDNVVEQEVSKTP